MVINLNTPQESNRLDDEGPERCHVCGASYFERCKQVGYGCKDPSEDHCHDCGHSPATGACYYCKRD